jgi:hypothetical protein
MKAARSFSIPLLSLTILVVAILIFWTSCVPVNPDGEKEEPPDWSEEPIQILKEYYDSLNAKDWGRALSFLEKPDPLWLKSWEATSPTYEILEIKKYSEYSAAQQDISPYWNEYEGDVEGKCISLYVSHNVNYPSGWGAEPSGTYSTAYILVEKESKWVIADWGLIGKDACTAKMKTLEAPGP